jgi:hypothetical protein
MAKGLIRTIAVIAVTASATTLFLFEHLTGRLPWSPEPGDGTITRIIHSSILDEDRVISIWLPGTYDSLKRYPTIYALDGPTHASLIAQTLHVLSSAGFAPEAIVVGIPNLSDETRKRDLTPPELAQDTDGESGPAGEADTFLEFMEAELIPTIESTFATNGHRVLSGNSRAGLLVMYSLFKRPGLFQSRLCFSAPLWRQEARMLGEFRDFLVSRDTLDTFLYVSAGQLETGNILSGVRGVREICETKTPLGFVWHAEHTPSATHRDNAELSMARAAGHWARHYLRMTSGVMNSSCSGCAPRA